MNTKAPISVKYFMEPDSKMGDQSYSNYRSNIDLRAHYYGRFWGLSQAEYWLKFFLELMSMCLWPNDKDNTGNMKNILLKYLIAASQHPAELI